MQIDDFLQKELPVIGTLDEFYNYFDTLLDHREIYGGGLLEYEIRRINNKIGGDSPEAQDLKSNLTREAGEKYRALVHSVMTKVGENLTNLDLYQIYFLLNRQHISSSSDNVILAARKKDNDPEFYNELEHKIEEHMGKLAKQRYETLTAKLESERYRTLYDAEGDINTCYLAAKILGYEPDEGLLKAARVRAVSNEIKDITEKPLKKDDFEPNQVEIRKKTTQQYGVEVFERELPETIKEGMKCVPFENILGLLVYAHTQTPRGMLIELPHDTLARLRDYRELISKAHHDLFAGEKKDLYVSNKRYEEYSTLKRTFRIKRLVETGARDPFLLN